MVIFRPCTGAVALFIRYTCITHDLESIIADKPLLRFLGVQYDFPEQTVLGQIKRPHQNPSRSHRITLVFMPSDGPAGLLFIVQARCSKYAGRLKSLL